MRKLVSSIFKTLLTLIAGFLLLSRCSAQADTEFPPGFIFYAKLHTGMVTKFNASPDLFTGGIQLSPQYTVVPHLLRAGIIAGGFFTSNKIQGDAGPMVSIKLKTFTVGLKGAPLGSVGNLHLRLDHLWGTGGQRLLGGGIIADIGNLITIGLTSQRDYRLNAWWFQSELGIRISGKKKIPEI